MIKQDTLKQLQSLVQENPGKNCYQLAGGRMFAVANRDTSCLTGKTRETGKVAVDGREFTIYVGGAEK